VIAVDVLAWAVMAVAVAEGVWRLCDWPRRDPGWLGVGGICTLVLLPVLVLAGA
jgi:hypothetical protein